MKARDYIMSSWKKSQLNQAIKQSNQDHRTLSDVSRYGYNLLAFILYFFPEMNFFVNKNAVNQSAGFKFWAASNYSSFDLDSAQARNFISQHARNPMNLDPKNDFNLQNISLLKFLNPMKPINIGYLYLKSLLGAGIDKIFGSTFNKQSTAATVTKGIVQVLLLPIELPIVLTTKLLDLPLRGINFLIKKIHAVVTSNSTQKSDPVNIELVDINKNNREEKSIDNKSLPTNKPENTNEQTLTQIVVPPVVIKQSSIDSQSTEDHSNPTTDVIERVQVQKIEDQNQNTIVTQPDLASSVMSTGLSYSYISSVLETNSSPHQIQTSPNETGEAIESSEENDVHIIDNNANLSSKKEVREENVSSATSVKNNAVLSWLIQKNPTNSFQTMILDTHEQQLIRAMKKN